MSAHENFSSKNDLELFESIDKNKVKSQIYEIRGIRVMLDRDIAAYFGVTTGNLNKAKNRNIERFPENFCFTLTDQEISLFQIGIPMQTKGIKGGRSNNPTVYSEHGLTMLTSVLHTPRAIAASIQIINVFVEIAHYVRQNAQLIPYQELKLLQNRQDLLRGGEIDPLLKEAGSHTFTMSPSRWIELTNAKGLVSKNGVNSGTYAQKDIAFKFASWVSPEFELYLIKEFQRLKEDEQKQIDWSAKRELAKINYHIHTSAVSHNLIPPELTAAQKSFVYADEADLLNVAMFGMTAKEWRDSNPDLKGNIRDYASINQLICLSNMENLNAVFINDGLPQPERLEKLNKIAISQMQVLENIEERRLLTDKK